MSPLRPWTMAIRIEAGQIITGDGAVYQDGTIQIEANTIVDVGPAENGAGDDVDESYHLPDHTLMPGLIDSHVHLSLSANPITEDSVGRSSTQVAIDAVKSARRTVHAGVTTVRDLGSPSDTVTTVRNETEAGELVGPRILAAGEGLVITGGHGVISPLHLDASAAPGRIARETDGVADMKKAVREQVARGADVIKLYVSGGMTESEGILKGQHFSEEELSAAVAEASRHGLPVTAHAHPPGGIIAAVEAGVDSIEHGTFINQEAIDLMAKNDVDLVPTISIMDKLATSETVPEHYRNNAQSALDNYTSMIPEARDRGITVGMGTDVGAIVYENGANAYELECLVDTGLEPLEVIEIGTRETAEILDLDDTIGQLKTGYAADLLAVRGNPLDDISILQDHGRIDLVMKDGEMISHSLN